MRARRDKYDFDKRLLFLSSWTFASVKTRIMGRIAYIYSTSAALCPLTKTLTTRYCAAPVSSGGLVEWLIDCARLPHDANESCELAAGHGHKTSAVPATSATGSHYCSKTSTWINGRPLVWAVALVDLATTLSIGVFSCCFLAFWPVSLNSGSWIYASEPPYTRWRSS